MHPVNGSGWRSRVTETLVLILAIAVVARIVAGLLDPLLPTLIALIVISAAAAYVLYRK